MNLHELKIPSNITIKVPEKCYFKKYPFKLEFEASNSARQASMTSTARWQMRRTNYWEVRKEITDVINSLIRKEEKSKSCEFDYRIRQEGSTVSIFFNDVTILGLILNDKIKSKATVLYKPLNENHLTKMEVEKRVRVRRTLFINKFRHKLYLKPAVLRKTNIVDLEKWLSETFPEEDRVQFNPGLKIAFLNGKINQKNKYSWQYNTTLAIYFNDETDMMVAKLRLHDLISHIEEAVLLSEL